MGPVCKRPLCELGKKRQEVVGAVLRGAGWNVWHRLLAEVRGYGKGGETCAQSRGQQVGLGVDGSWQLRHWTWGGRGSVLMPSWQPIPCGQHSATLLPLDKCMQPISRVSAGPLAGRCSPLQETGNIKEHASSLACFSWTLRGSLGEGYCRVSADLPSTVSSAVSFKQELLQDTALHSCQNPTGTTLQRTRVSASAT